MSKISIHRPINGDRDAALNALKHAADAIATKYDMETHWEDDAIHFSRTGVDGFMRVADDHINIEAKLGFLLAMLRGPIEDEIGRQLDEYLT